MKINILGKWSAKRLIPTILCLFLMTSIRCHYGDLSDVDSTFQSMFKNFSSIFDSSKPERELSPLATPSVQEVQFTDENGNLKAEKEIKKEIEQKFNVHNADSLGIDSVIHDLVSQGAPEKTKSRKLNGDLENKITRAMNLGLGGELLSENPEIKQMDSVKKSKNFVEFDNKAGINDQFEKDFENKNGKGTLKAKTWGENVVKHRIGENGLKTVETTHKTHKIMKKVSKGDNGSSSIQEMSFSSSSMNGNPSMEMPEMKMSMDMPDLEDSQMDEMFFPEEEIKKMNEMQAKMMGNLDQMFAAPEDFVKVAPPRELRQRRRKSRKKRRKHKKKHKNRKLSNYDYEYPESVYGYNSHIIDNPVNCPDCAENAYIPKIDYDSMPSPSQELNQFQENNYIANQTNMNQQNMQQNNVNNIHNHYHHHQAFDPSLASNIGVEDYDKMEKLYQDYLNALIEFNHEVPTDASARAVGKQMTVLEHQLVNHHQKNPYFGTEAITLPPMMSTDSELALHMPVKMETPVSSKTTVHHHYIAPSYNEYTFHAMPMMPVVQAPTPEMVHNYQLLMDMPHPLAGMVPQVQQTQIEETHKEMQHMKKDLEVEFKNDLQIEVGNVMRHEDELQKHTDEEIDHLMDLTRNVQNSMSKPAPTLNVEHTVMGVDGHSIHETKEGEIIVENHSESHSIKNGGGDQYGGDSGSYSEPSDHTEVIQKVTPIIIGNPGGFGGSDSYSGSYSNSASQSRSSSSGDRSQVSKGEGSEEIIIQKGDQITQKHIENDHDEDHNKIVDSSAANSSEVHSKNSIYNEKNTHIVHHMGAPSDSKVLNIHLDLLSDGKGGFYFQDKDGKPIGSAGTLTEKYDVLNHQLDTIRVKEAANFKKSGKMNEEGYIGEGSTISNMGDENITTQINKIDDLHEVTTEDLKNIGKGDQTVVETLEPADRIKNEDDLTPDETEGLNDLETKQVTPLDQEQESDIHQDLEQVSVSDDSVVENENLDNLVEEASTVSKVSGDQSTLMDENEITPDMTSEVQMSETSGLRNEDEITPDITSEMQISEKSGLQNEDEITPDITSEAQLSEKSGLRNEDEITPDITSEAQLSEKSGFMNENEITPDITSAEQLSETTQPVNEDEITPDITSAEQLSEKTQSVNEDENIPDLQTEVSQQTIPVNEDEITPDTQTNLDIDTDNEEIQSPKSESVNESQITPDNQDEISQESTSVDQIQPSVVENDQTDLVDTDLDAEIELSNQSGLKNEDEITPDIMSESQLSAKSDSLNEDEITPDTQEQSKISEPINEDEISSDSQKSVPSEIVNDDDIEPLTQTSQKSETLDVSPVVDQEKVSELVDESNLEGGNNDSELVSEDALNSVDQLDNESADLEGNVNGDVNMEKVSEMVDEDDLDNKLDITDKSELVTEDNLDNVKDINDSELVTEDDLDNKLDINDDSELVTEDNLATKNDLSDDSELVTEDDLDTKNDLSDESKLVSEDDLDNISENGNPSELVSEDDLSPKNRILRFRTQEKNNRENPFKHHSPIFEEMGRNFLVNPPSAEPRSMKQIAAEFDKNFGDDSDLRESPKFVEPRELFENLDVTAKLRSKLGIGKKGNVVKDYKPLF